MNIAPWKTRKTAARLADLRAKREDAISALAAAKATRDTLAQERLSAATRAVMRAELRG